MSCACTGELIRCLRAYVNPCDEGIDTGLVASVAGDYLILLNGAQTAKKFVITLAEGEQIILPNDILNSYTYDLQIFLPEGSLLDDTCFRLTTTLTMGAGSSILPPTPTVKTTQCSIEVYIVDNPDTSIPFLLCNGDTVQREYAPADTLTILDMDGVPYLPGLNVLRPYFYADGVSQEMLYNSVTGTFDYSAQGGFSSRSLFTVNAYVRI